MQIYQNKALVLKILDIFLILAPEQLAHEKQPCKKWPRSRKFKKIN